WASRVAYKSWHRSRARSRARASSGSSGSYSSPASIFSRSLLIAVRSRSIFAIGFLVDPRGLRSRLEIQHGGGNPEFLGVVHWMHPQERHPAPVGVDAEIVAKEPQAIQI